MCGRFGLFSPADVLAELLGIDEMPSIEPRYNIAPSQHVLAVCKKEAWEPRVAVFFSWGLVPHWSTKSTFKLINARGETIGEKPAFRSAFRSRRCLIPADGFFEWKKVGRERQPFFFRMKSRKPFAIAGVFERWENPVGRATSSCALVTTRANELLRGVHERMPVILPRNQYDSWLDRERRDEADLMSMIQSYPADRMEGYRVGKAVNTASFDDAECVAPQSQSLDGPERSLFD